jgi:large subunit ribosomal protein L27e
VHISFTVSLILLSIHHTFVHSFVVLSNLPISRSIKAGKVVVITAGRYAGKKAIVVKPYDEGTKEREFGHALVAGIEKAPLAVSKAMSKKKILKRSKVKPFLKFINYQHMMPTRYSADIIPKDTVIPSSAKQADKKKETNKELKKVFKTKCVFYSILFCQSSSLSLSILRDRELALASQILISSSSFYFVWATYLVLNYYR